MVASTGRAVGLENSRSFEAAKSSAAGPGSAAIFAGVERDAWGDVETEAGVALAVGTRPSGVDAGVRAGLAAAETCPGTGVALAVGTKRSRVDAGVTAGLAAAATSPGSGVAAPTMSSSDRTAAATMSSSGDLLGELLRRRGRRGERCLDLPARLRAQSARGGEDRLEVGGDRLAGSERYGFADGRAERVGARMTILAVRRPRLVHHGGERQGEVGRSERHRRTLRRLSDEALVKELPYPEKIVGDPGAARHAEPGHRGGAALVHEHGLRTQEPVHDRLGPAVRVGEPGADVRGDARCDVPGQAPRIEDLAQGERVAPDGDRGEVVADRLDAHRRDDVGVKELRRPLHLTAEPPEPPRVVRQRAGIQREHDGARRVRSSIHRDVEVARRRRQGRDDLEAIRGSHTGHGTPRIASSTGRSRREAALARQEAVGEEPDVGPRAARAFGPHHQR